MTRASSLRVLLALLALAGCKGKALGIPWDFERMTEQPRYEPYGASRFFADGRAMRPPPEGVRARDAESEEATAPAPDRALLERGRERFEIYCAACHGRDGFARTGVAQSMRLRPPPSLHEPRLRALPVEGIRGVLARGYGLMPAYRGLLTSRDEWAVAFYVRALQLSRGVALEALPADVRERARQALAREEVRR